MRALLPVVRLRSSVLPLAVVNGDAKTVVRLVIERAEAVEGSRHVPLAPRLTVEPVLGYDDDLGAHAACAARPARARAGGAPGVRRGGRGGRRAARRRALEAEASRSPRARAPMPPPPRC